MTAHELTTQLKTTYNRRYYEILKQLHGLIATDLTADFEAIKQHNGGKIRPVDLGVLALRYEVSLKAMCRLLNECRLIGCHQYDRIIADIAVQDVFDAARQVTDGPVKPVSRYSEE